MFNSVELPIKSRVKTNREVYQRYAWSLLRPLLCVMKEGFPTESQGPP